MARKIFLNVTDGSLAGGGISSMFRESEYGFQKLCITNGWNMLTVSGAPNSATNRQFRFSSTSYRERHAQAAEFVDRLVKELAGAEIAAFIWGYTSYFPYAFQSHLRRGTVKSVAWADSSPPDTDELGTDMAKSRFVSSAYEGTTEIVWSWHDFDEHDPRLTARVPPGVRLLKTSRPFPLEYLETLAQMKQPRSHRSEALVVLAVSPDYWLRDGVGKWITQEQWADVRSKTLDVLCSLEAVAARLGPSRSLNVVANPAIAQLGFQPKNFWLRLQKSQPEEYRRLLASADLALIRTSCCVTSVECAHMGVPQYLHLMPSLNYMNVEVFEDAARRQDLVSLAGESLREGLWEALQADSFRFSENASREAVRFDQSTNFFDAIQDILLN